MSSDLLGRIKRAVLAGYTKGKLVEEADTDRYCFLVTSKKALRCR